MFLPYGERRLQAPEGITGWRGLDTPGTV